MKRTTLKRKSALGRLARTRICVGEGCKALVTEGSKTGLCKRCNGLRVAATGAGAAAMVAKALRVQKACAVCGASFDTYPSELLRRKTCSYECAAVYKRQRESDRTGAKNPNFRSGARAGVRDRAGERRWYVALGSCCERCGKTRGLHLHHVSYRQEVRRRNGDEWDPRNGMTLCVGCHSSHHGRGRVIPLVAIPDSAIEFAVELMGLAAHVYLSRMYDGHDERLELAIAELGAPDACG